MANILKTYEKKVESAGRIQKVSFGVPARVMLRLVELGMRKIDSKMLRNCLMLLLAFFSITVPFRSSMSRWVT